jgi:hypothetical protein
MASPIAAIRSRSEIHEKFPAAHIDVSDVVRLKVGGPGRASEIRSIARKSPSQPICGKLVGSGGGSDNLHGYGVIAIDVERSHCGVEVDLDFTGVDDPSLRKKKLRALSMNESDSQEHDGNDRRSFHLTPL